MKFLEKAAGVCWMKGEEILVEAYVSAFGGKQTEIGAIPGEAFRGPGYPPLTCAFLIEICEKRGCQAIDLEVDVNHRAAERLYRRHGFKKLSRQRWVRILRKD